MIGVLAVPVSSRRSAPEQTSHRAVGELTLDFEIATLDGDPGLKLIIFSAEPHSPAHDGLVLLANWAAAMDMAPAASE